MSESVQRKLWATCPWYLFPTQYSAPDDTYASHAYADVPYGYPAYGAGFVLSLYPGLGLSLGFGGSRLLWPTILYPAIHLLTARVLRPAVLFWSPELRSQFLRSSSSIGRWQSTHIQESKPHKDETVLAEIRDEALVSASSSQDILVAPGQSHSSKAIARFS